MRYLISVSIGGEVESIGNKDEIRNMVVNSFNALSIEGVKINNMSITVSEKFEYPGNIANTMPQGMKE